MGQELLHSDASHTYDCSDLSDRFQLLLDGIDFKTIISDLGLKQWNVIKRKKALIEFNALCIVLWKIALEKSFPGIASHCFQSFLEGLKADNGKNKNKALLERISIYIDILVTKGDSDFYEVATYIVDIYTLGSGDQKRYRLQLSLNIRRLYNIIFDRLI